MALLRIILMFCTVFQNRHREGHAQTIPLCFPSRSTGSCISAAHLGVVLRRCFSATWASHRAVHSLKGAMVRTFCADRLRLGTDR